MMDDTISRAAAIDAVNNMIRRKFGISADLGTGALLELPSVTDTNVGGNLIDRQAALDAIKKLEKPAPTAQHLSAIFDCEDTIKALPSAQRYTDEEVQKIQDLEQLEIEKAFQLGREDAQRWIPCNSEHLEDYELPKQHERVLVSFVDRRNRKHPEKPVIRIGINSVEKNYGKPFWRYGNGFSVVAWMPLPKPWEGGQDNG